MAFGKENQFQAIGLNMCKIAEPVNNFQNHRVTLFCSVSVCKND